MRFSRKFLLLYLTWVLLIIAALYSAFAGQYDVGSGLAECLFVTHECRVGEDFNARIE